VDNFTNDSAMMIAWERSLETKRGADALFSDPFAEALAGSKGEKLSEEFGASKCTPFGFEGWPEFHKMWTAVRTRFIDDYITKAAATSTYAQMVNLGAGMDTRPYRMECYKGFANGCIGVDMAVVNAAKVQVFSDFLHAPSPHCAVSNVDLDFLAEDKTLATELAKEPQFDGAKPSLFLSEGLIMYLGPVGKLKLLKDVSAVAAPGSVFVLQFSDPSESEVAKNTPGAVEAGLSAEDARCELDSLGWTGIEFCRYGDESVSFGRFPADKFKPSASFSFCIATKA
jgi:methyltransferase (TIGR00027 family)